MESENHNHAFLVEIAITPSEVVEEMGVTYPIAEKVLWAMCRYGLLADKGLLVLEYLAKENERIQDHG